MQRLPKQGKRVAPTSWSVISMILFSTSLALPPAWGFSWAVAAGGEAGQGR